MNSFTFDVETNGLLDHLTHIKCLNIINNATGAELRFTNSVQYYDAYTGEATDRACPRSGDIRDGLDLLETADEICGHNIIGFDIPAIQKVYPDWKPTGDIFDTQVCSRLFYTDINERDAESVRKGKYIMPGKYKQRPHSLGAWGIRLGGTQKGDFLPSDFGWTWNEYPFSKECDDYCMDDVIVNYNLVLKMQSRLEEMNWPLASVHLENHVNTILTRQTQYGWLYDVEAAQKLTAELQIEVADVIERLQGVFPDFYKRDGKVEAYKEPKKTWYSRQFVVSELGADSRKYKGEVQQGYWSYNSGERQKVKLTQFNPGSRDHIAMMLTRKYEWHPQKFTPSGKPQVDESILGELPWAEAKACAEYFLVNKKLAQVAEGKQAQLKKVGKDGRMRGYVNHNGAVTGRMSHSGPNVAQTDKDPRIRSLYIVGSGKKLVGCDADGIEGCCLANYLYRFDKGKYVDVILKGDKKNGTDLHSMNRQAVGLNSRDNAKTIFYAWMYGAGDPKLGMTVYDDWPEDKQTRFNARYKGRARVQKLAGIGRKARASLVAGIKGMDKLIKKVKDKSKFPGYVIGLDGRRVYCRSQHAALNTLLQSAGALIMKKALVLLDYTLQHEGLIPGVHYEFVGNIHDELQIEVDEDKADAVGRAAATAITAAGEFFAFNCPLSGSYDIGDNWSQTH